MTGDLPVESDFQNGDAISKFNQMNALIVQRCSELNIVVFWTQAIPPTLPTSSPREKRRGFNLPYNNSASNDDMEQIATAVAVTIRTNANTDIPDVQDFEQVKMVGQYDPENSLFSYEFNFTL